MKRAGYAIGLGAVAAAAFVIYYAVEFAQVLLGGPYGH